MAAGIIKYERFSPQNYKKYPFIYVYLDKKITRLGKRKSQASQLGFLGV